jgi:hypothetical protein
MAVDCTQIPTVEDFYKAKESAADMTTFTYDTAPSFVDGVGTSRKTLNALVTDIENDSAKSKESAADTATFAYDTAPSFVDGEGTSRKTLNAIVTDIENDSAKAKESAADTATFTYDTALSFVDAEGTSRKTLNGMITDIENDSDTVITGIENEGNAAIQIILDNGSAALQTVVDNGNTAIANIGWDVALGDFAVGKIITLSNQVLTYNGHWYKTTETLPYTTDGTTPTLDSGEWLLVSIADALELEARVIAAESYGNVFKVVPAFGDIANWGQIACSDDGQIVFALDKNYSGLYISLDSGATRLTGQGVGIVGDMWDVCCNGDGDVVFVTTTTGDLYKSTNYGTSFVQVTIAFDAGTVTCSNSGLRVFISSEVAQAVYKSTDGGVVFADVGYAFPNPIRSIACDFYAFDVWVLDNTNTLYRSLDVGSWVSLGAPYWSTTAVTNDCVSCENQSSTVHVMIGGKVHLSYDDGTTFTPQRSVYGEKINNRVSSADGSIVFYSQYLSPNRAVRRSPPLY